MQTLTPVSAMRLSRTGRNLARAGPAAVAVAGICALSLSARTASARPTTIQQAPKTEVVQPALLTGVELTRGNVLNRPGKIRLIGNTLIVLDVAGDSQVRVFDSKTGNHIGSVGRRGAGPGELTGAWTVHPAAPGATGFWVFDISLRRFTNYMRSPESRDGPGAYSAGRVISFWSGVNFTDVTWASGDSLLAIGLFTSPARLAVIDTTGTPLRLIGQLPPSGAGEPIAVRQQAHQAHMAVSADRRRVAVASRHSDRLEIYDLFGKLLARGDRPFAFEPRFSIAERDGHPLMASGDDLRFGYIDLVATDDQIFGLFSGVRRGDGRGTASFGRLIHVFDWSGHLLRAYRLDAALASIAVSADAQSLYGVRHDPSPQIIRYALGGR
jgi:hypothetical protein